MAFKKHFKKTFKKPYYKTRKPKKLGKVMKNYFDLATAELPLIKRNNMSKIYKFKRSVINATSLLQLLSTSTWNYSPIITYPSSGYNSSYAIYGFSFSDIPSYTDFTKLFQRVRLRKVKLTFRAPDLTTSGNPLPTATVGKYTSNVYPAVFTPNTLGQLANITEYQFSQEHRQFSVSLYPMLMQFVQVASSTASTVNLGAFGKNNIWLDANDITGTTNPVYTGLMASWQNIGSNAATEIVVDVQYSIECKDPY